MRALIHLEIRYSEPLNNRSLKASRVLLVQYVNVLDVSSRREIANQLMKELQGVGNTFEPNVDQMVVHEVMSYIKQYASLLCENGSILIQHVFLSIKESQATFSHVSHFEILNKRIF